jgi:hypothetical protein
MLLLRRYVSVTVVAILAAAVVVGGPAAAGVRQQAQRKATDGFRTMQGNGVMQTFAKSVPENGVAVIFTLPGVVRVSVKCLSQVASFSVLFDQEQARGWASAFEVSGTSGAGGGGSLSPGGGGSIGGFDNAGFVTISIRAGFGTAAKVATVLMNERQPNSHRCWVSGQAFRN